MFKRWPIQRTQDGRRRLSARFGEIQFWDVAHNKLLRSIKLGSDTLLSAAFSPDDKYLAVGRPDKTVRIFDTATGEAIKKMENHEDWVFGTVFSVDGKLWSPSAATISSNYRRWPVARFGELNLLTTPSRWSWRTLLRRAPSQV